MSRADVVVLLVVVVVTILFLLVSIPVGRENARLASCQFNLSMIGRALAAYEQSQQTLPEVGTLTDPDSPREAQPPGPLRTLLETLQVPSFLVYKDPEKPPRPSAGAVPGEAPVAGFVCSSDANATSGRFQAPISYRATTGDAPPGLNGAFAPGRVLKLPEVDAVDGRTYTAAFSERLVGDNQREHIASINYRLVSPPLDSPPCPTGDPDPSGWRGDAGSSWFLSGYRSTLYNHALPPGGGQPSCLALDGKTAFMGASSGHTRGVNLLLIDGSVSIKRPSIDLKVWKEFARINPAERTE